MRAVIRVSSKGFERKAAREVDAIDREARAVRRDPVCARTSTGGSTTVLEEHDEELRTRVHRHLNVDGTAEERQNGRHRFDPFWACRRCRR